ncbi:uncharacterized protein LOC129776236 [Toxorhynchites rutilus septentrionalis]|uniref:uncharacterized protein LOC129776236 n=1 Tax=Toxorhynchites rutilus septentrionalis TaxID=329112 RepID=UPI00247AD91F|nr:uncharacterized protein LOC129776236 [Toxorhynchites rutilus septentrionalis]
MMNLKSHIGEELTTLTDPQLSEPYSVLGNGDCWINNMMFAYKDGYPVDIILLDWQISRYVSPALDLLYFIFCCTDEKLRRQHYNALIHLYYASLKELLERLGGDTARQFPFTALFQQLQTCGKFGLLMAVLIVPLLYTNKTDLPTIDAEAEKLDETKQMDLPSGMNEQSGAKYRK